MQAYSGGGGGDSGALQHGSDDDEEDREAARKPHSNSCAAAVEVVAGAVEKLGIQDATAVKGSSAEQSDASVDDVHEVRALLVLPICSRPLVCTSTLFIASGCYASVVSSHVMPLLCCLLLACLRCAIFIAHSGWDTPHVLSRESLL